MSTLYNDDQFVVESNGQVSTVQNQNRSSLNGEDLFLVQRGTTLYKVKASDVSTGGGGSDGAPVLSTVTLTQDGAIDGNRFTSKSFTSTLDTSGGAATTAEMTATITGELGLNAGSEPITANGYTGTDSTSIPLTLEGTTNLTDVIQEGDTVVASSSYTPETDAIASIGSADIQYLGNWVGATVRTGNIWQGNTAQYDVDQMFNGTTTPYSPGGANEYATITFDPPIPTTRLRLRATTSNQNSDAYLVINGVDFGNATRSFPTGGGVTTAPTTWTAISNVPDTITTLSIGWKSSWSACSGIEINNVELRQGVPLDVVTGNTKLTLSSEKDIALFQAGDLVQNSYINGEIWSGYGDGNTLNQTNYNQTKVFNSTITSSDDYTIGPATSGEFWTWEYPEGIPFTTLEIHGAKNTSQVTFDGLKINGEPITNFADFGEWSPSVVGTRITPTFGVNIGNTLTKIELRSWNQGGIAIAAIYLDGKMLVDNGIDDPNTISVVSTDVSAKTITVDGGDFKAIDGTSSGNIAFAWNQDEIWSDLMSEANAEAAFDGSLATQSSPTGGYSLFTPNITNVTKIRIQVRRNNATSFRDQAITINDTFTTTIPANQNTSLYEIALPSTPFTLTKLEIQDQDFGTGSVAMIEVNDRPLVDFGITGGPIDKGDTTVSTISPKQGSGTVSSINSNVVTVSPFSNNCYKEGQWLTVNKTINVDPKTDKINTVNNTIITVNGITDLDQFADGDSVFMTDNSSSGASTKTGYKLVTADIKSVGPRPSFDWNSSLSRGGALVNDQGWWTPANVFNGNPDIGLTQRNQTTTSAIPYVIWSSNILSDFFYASTAVVKCNYAVYAGGTHTPNWANSMRITYIVDAGTPGASELVQVVTGTESAEYLNAYEYVLPRPDLPIKSFYIQSNLGGGDKTWPQTQFFFIVFDGQMLENNPSGTLLTFDGDENTNPDLQYFQKDDIIVPGVQQTVTGTADALIGFSQSFVLLDGTAPAYSGTDVTNFNQYLGNGNSDGASELIVFDPPITHPTNNIHLNCFLQPNAGTITVNVGKDGEQTLSKTANSTWGYQTTGSKTLYNFRFDGRTSSSAVLAGVQFASTTGSAAGRVTTDTGKTDPVKVIDVDTTNNNMIVDGGNWSTPYNSDQKWSSGKINNNFAGDTTSAFNGILSSDANEGRVRPSNGNTFGYTFSGLDNVTSLRIWVYEAGSNASFSVNGIDVTSTVNSADNESWVDFGSAFSELTGITFTSVNGSNFFSIAGVEVNGAILLDPSFEPSGDTKIEYQTTGGTGTIAAGGIDFTNRTITLTAAGSGDARWIGNNKAGTVFRVATDTKAAVSTTAYLKFDAGGAVTGYQATPVEPRAMDNKVSPKLTFPATFSNTGSAPDTEFSDENAYIKTSVQLKNISGNSAIKTSNPVVPNTGFRSIGSGETAYNENTLREMLRQNLTLDLRVASKTASNIQSVLSEFDIKVDNYLTEETN